MLLAWISLALLQLRVVAADDPPFATPVAEGLGVEYYDSGETRFGIFMEKVSWQEASKLCHSRSGGLVEYTKEGTSAFVGRALAESAVSFASLWIGGEFTPSDTIDGEGVWKWSQTQELIESKLDGINKFPMTSPPYWVDRPNLLSRLPLCLATDRNKHHNALVVAEPCDRKRPYICSLPKGNITEGLPITVTPPVNVGGKKFHLFGHLKTWTEALTQCRLLGMKLAKLTTAQEFRIIRNRMLRQRPIMENAWISGIVTEGQWVWIDNYEPINVDPSRADVAHPFAWYRPNNIIMDGCLLADRHLCDHFVYVEAKCDRRRNFICEKEKPGGTQVILPPLIRVPGTDYFISTFEENWFKAQNVCRACLDSELMQIETTREGVAVQLPMLYTAMALTLQVEIQHIWIGGYLFGNKFKWANNARTEPPDDKILNYELFDGLHERGERGRLVYCKTDFRVHSYLLQFKCLNLDRENQKYYTMYGLKCHNKQYFICKSGDGRGLDKSCVGGGVVDIPDPVGTLVTFSRPLPTSRTDEETQAVTTPLGGVTTKPTATTKQPSDLKYWISNYADDWSLGQKACKKCLGGELMQITGDVDKQIIQFRIINWAMQKELPNPVRQVWLGGYQYKEKYKWTEDKDIEPGEDKAFNPDQFKYLPEDKVLGKIKYMRNNERPPDKPEVLQKKCLALDLTNDNYTLTSWLCVEKYHFMCQSKVGTALNPECASQLVGPITPHQTPPKTDKGNKQREKGQEGKLPTWVGVVKQSGFWIIAKRDTFKGAVKSCQDCLAGELILIAKESKGQAKQMNMIFAALRHTLPKDVKQIWLMNDTIVGEYKPDKDEKQWQEKYPVVVNQINPYSGMQSKRCPVLSWKLDYAEMLAVQCIVKRHAICHTAVGRELNKSCYKGEDEDY